MMLVGYNVGLCWLVVWMDRMGDFCRVGGLDIIDWIEYILFMEI